MEPATNTWYRVRARRLYGIKYKYTFSSMLSAYVYVTDTVCWCDRAVARRSRDVQRGETERVQGWRAPVVAPGDDPLPSRPRRNRRRHQPTAWTRSRFQSAFHPPRPHPARPHILRNTCLARHGARWPPEFVARTHRPRMLVRPSCFPLEPWYHRLLTCQK